MMMKQREMSPKMLQGVAKHILVINNAQIQFLRKKYFFEPVEPRSEPLNQTSKVAPKRNFLSKSPQNRSK